MDLSHALAFSRYARRALPQAPDLAADLERHLAAPFDWDAPAHRAPAGIAAAALGLRLRGCAGACTW